ncbi:MAG: NAD-binding protein, partial [Clostridia bacterium]|nr:NAD-binding protein [Clostridia bacterium]
MKLINNQNIMIVGLGLMGGSYAKALKRLDFHISAIDKNPESIRYAIENGIIDEGYTAPNEAALKKADVII